MFNMLSLIRFFKKKVSRKQSEEKVYGVFNLLSREHLLQLLRVYIEKLSFDRKITVQSGKGRIIFHNTY